ncbi:unnamed protein product, partial [Discosporangium mesarthrocarpum]
SPAAKGGLQPGDVIVAVDGERIEKMRELPRRIARISAGSDTQMTVIRGGTERTLTVTIGKMPTAEKVAAVSPEKVEKPRFGMVLSALNDKTRAQFGLDKGDAGVVVSDVDPGGIAAEKGVRPGDVIRRISGQEVSSPEDVRRIVDKAVRDAKSDKRKALLVLVNRNGNDRYVALPLRDA